MGGAQPEGQRLTVRADAVEWRRVDAEIVIQVRSSGAYLVLNPSASELWEILAEGASAIELTDELVSRHGIDRQRASEDVRQLLDDLGTRGLLQEVADG
jgi:hypothetical protein